MMRSSTSLLAGSCLFCCRRGSRPRAAAYLFSLRERDAFVSSSLGCRPSELDGSIIITVRHQFHSGRRPSSVARLPTPTATKRRGRVRHGIITVLVSIPTNNLVPAHVSHPRSRSRSQSPHAPSFLSFFLSFLLGAGDSEGRSRRVSPSPLVPPRTPDGRTDGRGKATSRFGGGSPSRLQLATSDSGGLLGPLTDFDSVPASLPSLGRRRRRSSRPSEQRRGIRPSSPPRPASTDGGFPADPRLDLPVFLLLGFTTLPAEFA